MKIRFSDHALAQIRQRKIAKTLIEQALRSPDRTVTQRVPRYRALKQMLIGGKLYLLIVIYDRIGSNFTIVTAFRTSKLEKYL